MSEPKTLIEAVRHFSDLSVCHEYMLKLKWPDGKPVCPKCGSDRVSELKTRRILKCNVSACQKQFSAKVGTIFESSPLGLDKWFVAVWSIADAKNGISSMEVHRAIGVSQKTAWFMLHRIRVAMTAKTFRKLSGEVESDETFVGGKAKNMHKAKREKVIQGRGAVGKTIVHGLLERSDEGTTATASTPTTRGWVRDTSITGSTSTAARSAVGKPARSVSLSSAKESRHEQGNKRRQGVR